MATLPTKDCVLISFNSLLPELGQKIVEYIQEELHQESFYYMEIMNFPLDSTDETPAQTKLRETHIQDWIDDLVTRKGWNFQSYDPDTVLNKFLYLVFHAEINKKTRLEKRLHTQLEASMPRNSVNADKTEQMKGNAQQTDPAPILDNMLKVVKASYAEKYGALMAAGTETIKKKIMENLSPAIISLFEKNKSLNVDNLLSIRGNFSSQQPSIYMHIIRKTLDPTQFYLYIGQAQDLQKRISQHTSPANRRKHPSLHYHVLESGSGSDSMHGTFVVLSSCNVSSTHLQHYLNLMELFGCLLFQTLPEKILREFLPANVEIIKPGAHLNVASPIHQGMQNPGWSLMLLRKSEDPLVQAYYASRLGHGAATRREAQLTLTKEGGLRALRLSYTLSFSIGCLNQEFFIPKDVCQAFGLTKDEPVYVEFEIADPDSHPNLCALDARDEDPGKRIAVRVSGAMADGEAYMFYLSKTGEKAVKQMNTVFDFITGVEDTIDSIKVPRRYLAKNKTLGRPAHIYT
ncbi:MAG: hypothetical protein M1830_009659 [Pleopsidium flavum]|nr:MAG: hypothetical protein M1830_009659 [Pleopsidium flavum]